MTTAIAAWSVYFVAYQTWNMPEQIPATNTASRVAYTVLLAVPPSLAAWRWVRAPNGQRWAQNWPLLSVAALTTVAFALACYEDFTTRATPGPLFGAIFYAFISLVGPHAIAMHLDTYGRRDV
ncbi:hypothetical protein F8280_33365 [Micromonospora noduli]|uniref:hypothetical protein n=1 Tax=Micromonospora noduli TaxID=709876 RepID=UPI00124B087B|nr:hypothetical protein [Micromonospora noduli]KAB1912369.1 hypothetical protein F8280_33365 [Micromonospora noduli]